MKTSNGKKLWLKTLINLRCIYTEINKQLVKDKKIRIKPIDRLFKIFNTDRTKNGKVTRFTPLELKIDGYIERINTLVINLNSMDMFLGYNWLVKHNLEVNTMF